MEKYLAKKQTMEYEVNSDINNIWNVRSNPEKTSEEIRGQRTN